MKCPECLRAGKITKGSKDTYYCDNCRDYFGKTSGDYTKGGASLHYEDCPYSLVREGED